MQISPATDRATSYFVSDSADRRLASIYYERDTESGEFALLDRETREVRKLFVQRKALADVPLAQDAAGDHPLARRSAASTAI